MAVTGRSFIYIKSRLFMRKKDDISFLLRGLILSAIASSDYTKLSVIHNVTLLSYRHVLQADIRYRSIRGYKENGIWFLLLCMIWRRFFAYWFLSSIILLSLLFLNIDYWCSSKSRLAHKVISFFSHGLISEDFFWWMNIAIQTRASPPRRTSPQYDTNFADYHTWPGSSPSLSMAARHLRLYRLSIGRRDGSITMPFISRHIRAEAFDIAYGLYIFAEGDDGWKSREIEEALGHWFCRIAYHILPSPLSCVLWWAETASSMISFRRGTIAVNYFCLWRSSRFAGERLFILLISDSDFDVNSLVKYYYFDRWRWFDARCVAIHNFSPLAGYGLRPRRALIQPAMRRATTCFRCGAYRLPIPAGLQTLPAYSQRGRRVTQFSSRPVVMQYSRGILPLRWHAEISLLCAAMPDARVLFCRGFRRRKRCQSYCFKARRGGDIVLLWLYLQIWYKLDDVASIICFWDYRILSAFWLCCFITASLFAVPLRRHAHYFYIGCTFISFLLAAALLPLKPSHTAAILSRRFLFNIFTITHTTIRTTVAAFPTQPRMRASSLG